MKIFFRAWVDSDESVFVYFLVPDNVKYSYDDDALNHPRIKKIPVPMIGRDQYDEKVIVPESLYALFNTDVGKYYYDLVFCDKAQIANLVKIMLSRKFKVNSFDTLPYVTLTQFLIKKEGRFQNILDEIEFSHCLGWMSGYNLFENERNASQCLSVAKKYLLPTHVMKIKEKSKIQNIYGLNTKVLDKYYTGNTYKAGEEIRINFANRAAIHYKLEEILDVVDYIFKSGINIRFIITTPTIALGMYAHKRISEMKRNGMKIDVHCGLSQPQFYEIAATCHFFISAIDELQSPNAYMEQLYLGQVGLFPKHNWVDGFFKDYPYRWNNLKDAFVTLKEFSQNPVPMIERNLIERNKLKEEYDISQNSVKVLDWLKKDVLPLYTSTSDSQTDLVRECVEKAGFPNNITITEFAEMLKKYSATKIDLYEPTFRRVNKFDYIKSLMSLGYKDTCEEELTFIKT